MNEINPAQINAGNLGVANCTVHNIEPQPLAIARSQAAVQIVHLRVTEVVVPGLSGAPCLAIVMTRAFITHHSPNCTEPISLYPLAD